MSTTGLVKIVVAGDVDSGKSTLIGRLLFETGSLATGVMEEIEEVSKKLGRECEFAYLLDSLEEERRDERTIDTTQVFARTRDNRELVFIDVPGHLELLKNMISGSSYADMAVLVIDVQKSIVEQTRRHAFILKLLGMRKMVLVFNKMDTVAYQEGAFSALLKQARDFLESIGAHAHACIPVSAKSGDNLTEGSGRMSWYKGPLVIDTFTEDGSRRCARDDFIFCIQDIYDFGKTPWAAGYIVSGSIGRSEKVRVLPQGQEFRVKSLRSFTRSQASAQAPESIGIYGDDMRVLKRGQVLCGRHAALRTGRSVSVKMFCVRPLDIAGTFSLRCLTQETPARIERIIEVWDTCDFTGKERLTALNEHDLVQGVLLTATDIATDPTGCYESLGRFVLQGADKEIYAMGIFI